MDYVILKLCYCLNVRKKSLDCNRSREGQAGSIALSLKLFLAKPRIFQTDQLMFYNATPSHYSSDMTLIALPLLSCNHDLLTFIFIEFARKTFFESRLGSWVINWWTVVRDHLTESDDEERSRGPEPLQPLHFVWSLLSLFISIVPYWYDGRRYVALW